LQQVGFSNGAFVVHGQQIAQVAEKSFSVLSLVEILSVQIRVGADGAIRGRRH
jgi:hypothetical protein